MTGELDYLHLALLGILAASLLFAMRGGRKSNQDITQTTTSTSPKTESPRPAAAIVHLAQAKKNPNNESAINEVCQTMATHLNQLATPIISHCYEPFVNEYVGLVDYLKQRDEMSLADLRHTISAPSIPKLLTSIDDEWAKACSFPQEIWDELISELDAAGLPASMSKYRFTTEQLHAESMKTNSLVRGREHTRFANAVNELRSLQSQADRMVIQIQNWANEGFDVGGFAKSFGAGVLAVVHPFIGIPALIHIISGGNKIDKMRTAHWEEFKGVYDKYLEQWDTCNGMLMEIHEEQIKKYQDRLSTLVTSTIRRILKNLDNDGIDLSIAS